MRRREFIVLLGGAALLMRAASHRMVESIDNDGGKWEGRPRDIVIIGSIVGRHGSPFFNSASPG